MNSAAETWYQFILGEFVSQERWLDMRDLLKLDSTQFYLLITTYSYNSIINIKYSGIT